MKAGEKISHFGLKTSVLGEKWKFQQLSVWLEMPNPLSDSLHTKKSFPAFVKKNTMFNTRWNAISDLGGVFAALVFVSCWTPVVLQNIYLGFLIKYCFIPENSCQSWPKTPERGGGTRRLRGIAIYTNRTQRTGFCFWFPQQLEKLF